MILPILAILASLLYGWIKLVSPGNVLFRQTRIGRDGKPFTIYKFRSMKLSVATHVHEAHVEHLIKSNKPMIKLDLAGDPRLIKGGFLMRSSGLDELPQVINILRGEMSLVGPRPCLPTEYELYDPNQRRRFVVKPGLTGLWQVSRTDSTTFSEMVKMDEEYINRLSLMADFQIIMKTPLALLEQMKACARPRTHSPNWRPAVNQSPEPSTTHHPAFALSMSGTRKLSD